MKRAIILTVLLTGILSFARASHITGGEMHYKFIGLSGGLYRYNFTIKLFQRCQSNRLFPDPAIVSIFYKDGGARVLDLNVIKAWQENISLGNINTCITNPPPVCYDVAYYEFSVNLPATLGGYIVACQVNFRINGITNLAQGSSDVGATYTAEIPGTLSAPDAPENNSAVWTGDDLVVVCASNSFTYSFAASDPDGDQLLYSFCEAYTNSAPNNSPPGSPPYFSVPYNFSSYGADHPLGNNVTIDPLTGLITGLAPSQGIFVVTVCVQEFRNGQLIAVQRKDLQIFIADCNIAAASLLPEYYLCGDTKTLSINNLSNSPLINSFHWQFINSSGTVLFNSTDAIPQYTFSDTGLYTVKLAINLDEACTDSTTSTVRVYPGFVPDFTAAGYCISKTTEFFDQSTSVYGTVNAWFWNFGENSTSFDLSDQKNPSFTYPSLGLKNPTLVVLDSKGCKDTITKDIAILEKPPILLAFPDTLICLNDRLQLAASGTGVFNWSPAVNIINSNTATPTVAPTTSTTYYVVMDDNGCINNDSVRVNLVDHVTLETMPDTVICQGDEIQLNINSDGLVYSWTPAIQLSNAGEQDPLVTTANTTNYEVLATIGGCSVRKNILVTTVPYPMAFAGNDTAICYNTPAQLTGQSGGSTYAWSPASSVSDPGALNTEANPVQTTTYYLTTHDSNGCPKPGLDSIIVFVDPKINAFAGNDTAILVGQPLQMNASGGIHYTWSPGEFLSASTIPNPIATINFPTDGIEYMVSVTTQAGCQDSAFVTVKVFKSNPVVFVPTAFTPNGDGKNDILRPYAVGVTQIEYFRIFNRWGQLIFSTTTNKDGWDGTIGGHQQTTGTFIWMVKANDYNGDPYFQKGTVTLIR